MCDCDLVPESQCQGPHFWTGARRDEGNAVAPFLWQLLGGGEQAMTYTNWYPGSPNNAGGANEACMFTGPGTGGVFQWDDAPCTWEFCGVCEIDI